MAQLKKEQINVERHSLSSLVIFEVTGEELEQLEAETLSLSEDFSFALAGLTIAVDALRPLMGESDNLFVTEITRKNNGQLSRKAWDWLKRHQV
jgi:hypothetical protein